MNDSAASFTRYLTTAVRVLPCCVFIVAMLAEIGCVSQRAYEQARHEADELNRSLEAARAEVTELGQRIGELETENQEKDTAAAELRASAQSEVEALPVLRRRANEKLTLLHTQVASLVSQSRGLARKIADAKKEHASLKVLVAQYKEEIEDARLLAETAEPEPTMAPPDPPIPAAAPMAEAQIPPPVASPNPVTTPPQQMAQVTPVTPAKSPPPAPPPSVPEEESWFDMIMNFFVSIWDWITGLFS